MWKIWAKCEMRKAKSEKRKAHSFNSAYFLGHNALSHYGMALINIGCATEIERANGNGDEEVTPTTQVRVKSQNRAIYIWMDYESNNSFSSKQTTTTDKVYSIQYAVLVVEERSVVKRRRVRLKLRQVTWQLHKTIYDAQANDAGTFRQMYTPLTYVPCTKTHVLCFSNIRLLVVANELYIFCFFSILSTWVL